MKSVLDLTARYLVDPAATAGLNPRQTAKLTGALARAGRTLGWSQADTVDYILAAAVLRLRHGRPTLYINNIGSSGSHWLLGMLKGGIGLLGTGEIYVPARFLNRRIAPMAPPHRAVFLQAVYLAHLMTGGAGDVENHVCNTAHVADLAPYTKNDIAALRILLIRDPVDVVLSRTLRKPEYRGYLGKDTADDASYLNDNIAIVDRFYRAVRPEDYDLVCRYEDLLADPVPTLVAIGRLLDVAFDPAKLRRTAEAKRRAAAPDAAAEAAPPDAFRETSARALADVRGKLGYG